MNKDKVMDDKQRKIITSWLERSKNMGPDPYDAFISLWISFNAYCYAKYAETANKRRADLRNDKGLGQITPTPSKAEGKIFLQVEQFRLEITKPGRISIVISERYTEDIIFSQFAKDYQEPYGELLNDSKSNESVKAFQDSLAKEDKRYVINMARKKDYDAKGDYRSMVAKHIIVPLENYRDLKQVINALYQVRCNLFHGEKFPLDPNDDRIVRPAYQVLLKIMESLIRDIA